MVKLFTLKVTIQDNLVHFDMLTVLLCIKI